MIVSSVQKSAPCLDPVSELRALAIRTHVRYQHHGLRALTIVRGRLLHRSLITAVKRSTQRSIFDLGDQHITRQPAD